MAKELVLPFSLVPPLPFLAKACRFDRVIFDGHEHYVKQTVRNRYHVLTANGVKALTIPAVGQKGIKTPTARIRIDHSKPWLRDHLRTIEAAYRSAPFYDHYVDRVSTIIQHQADTFGAFFAYALPQWLNLLKMELDYEMSAVYLKPDPSTTGLWNIKVPGDFPVSTTHVKYMQVFSDRYPFQPHLSILDLLFNEGPAASSILLSD